MSCTQTASESDMTSCSRLITDILFCPLMVSCTFDRSFSGEEFRDFVEGVLDKMQNCNMMASAMPNSVLVLDNASIHKIPGIREWLKHGEYFLGFTVECVCCIYRHILETECPVGDQYTMIWEAVYSALTPRKSMWV